MNKVILSIRVSISNLASLALIAKKRGIPFSNRSELVTNIIMAIINGEGKKVDSLDEAMTILRGLGLGDFGDSKKNRKAVAKALEMSIGNERSRVGDILSLIDNVDERD